MATRTISTRMAIQGESEYKAAVTRINAELRTLTSELKLAESEFKNNANSMEALKRKHDVLIRAQQQQKEKVDAMTDALTAARKAESAYAAKKEELRRKIQANNEALEELKKTTGDTSEEQQRLTKENAELNAELKKNEGYLNAASLGATRWEGQLNVAQMQLNELNADVKLNERYMAEAAKSADGCATSIDEFGNRADRAAQQTQELNDALKTDKIISALKLTAKALKECAASSIEFESAMTGVRKTTDLTDEEFAKMSEQIQALALRIPVTTTEIAGVAEAAGQLGIAKEDILSFTETMVNLGTATNLSSDEAASALAKFANVTNMTASDYDRLGSTIVDLGNNFATTESDIVSMATRLASAGSIVGLSQAQIMAVATALSSVGIEAEAGGSAISKLLNQFETMVKTGSPELEDFAQVAGMSASEFSAAWGQDAVGALSLFIDGLGRLDDEGGSSVATLNDLGITEVRMTNAVLSMASSNGILQKALNTANSAWAENTALTKEAQTRYETTESRLQLLKNAAEGVKIAVGDKLTPAIGEFADTGRDVLEWTAEIIDENEILIPLLTSSAIAVGVMTGGVIVYTTWTKVAAAAQTAWNAALAANPIGMVVLGVAAAAAGTIVLANTINNTIPSVHELTEEARGMQDAIDAANETFDESASATQAAANVADGYITRLEELEKTGLTTTDQQREYHATLAALCQTVPELAQYIDLENDTITGGTAVLRANTEAWKQNAIAQAYQERLKTLYQEQADVLIEAEKNSIGLAEAQGKMREVAEKQEQTQARLNELMEEATEKAREHNEATGDAASAAQYLTDEYYTLQNSLADLGAQQDEATRTADVYAQAVKDGEEAANAARDAIEQEQTAIDNLTGATGENTAATDENAASQGENAAAISEITTSLQTLAEKYKDAYNSAYENISGQIGLFDTFAAEVSDDTNTVEKMMERWATQTQNLAAYTENLQKAAQYGLDDGLIASLSDGSTESAGYLATIIGKIEELGGSTEGMSSEAETFVSDFNASFARTQEAKESFATTVAGIQTDLDTAIESLRQSAADADFSGFSEALSAAFANVGKDLESVGINAGAGLAQGIEQSTGQVETAADGTADAATDAAKAALGEHSPSTVWEAVGVNANAGLANGLKKDEAVKAAVEKTMRELTKQMERAMQDMTKQSVKSYGKLTAEVKKELEKLKQTASQTTASMPAQMTSIGTQMIDGMIRGLNNRASALYSTITRIVNTSISRAKRAADVRSPSHKTTEIFEQVGEGMVVGLEHKRQRVAQTTQSVVDEALKVDIGGGLAEALSAARRPEPDMTMRGAASAAEAETDRADLLRVMRNVDEKLSQLLDDDRAIVLDDGTIVGRWASMIDTALGRINKRKERGGA